jgi:hypothetical protein
MAKRGTSMLKSGAAVRVREGVTLPEFPDIPISGWTGQIVETKGRAASLQYIIEWDADTIAGMSADYRDHCEANGLAFEMACLPGEQVEGLD